jgi:hypothetical protein
MTKHETIEIPQAFDSLPTAYRWGALWHNLAANGRWIVRKDDGTAIKAIERPDLALSYSETDEPDEMTIDDVWTEIADAFDRADNA